MATEALCVAASAGRAGHRFCVYDPPLGDTVRGLVVHVPPLAEEMNRSRRMAALQARALAEAGYGVLRPDLLGCGDSSGDFGDATWQDWVDDIVDACRWLRARADAPLWLWGQRAGCLLAVTAAERLGEPCHFLLWQPPASGKVVLQQFLRLGAAGDLLTGAGKAAMAGLNQRLAAGESVEIAGYRLAPALAQGLERALLAAPAVPAPPGRMVVIELSTQPDATLTPAATLAQSRWQAQGWTVQGQVVDGPAFWQTTEVAVAPALLRASVRAISEAVAA